MFVPPTPENGSTLDFFTNNTIPVNVSVAGTGLHSVFLDWSNSLVGWWSMDFYNTSGAFDNSTYGTPNFAYFNNTNIIGSSKFQAGKYGLGINLTASNTTRRILVASKSNFSLGNYTNAEYTIEGWFQPATAFADASPDGYYGGISQCSKSAWYLNGNDDVWIGWTSYGGGAWETGFRLSNNTRITASFSDSPLVVGQWYHLVATRNTTQMVLYKNGVLKTTYNIPSSYQNNVRKKLDSVFCIGVSEIDGPSWQWNGTIDEVRVYRRSLSAQEILALYDASANKYSRNFTGLPVGDYYFRAWEINTTGIANSTGLRKVTISNLVGEE